MPTLHVRRRDWQHSGNSTGFVVAPATLADIAALAGLGLLVMRRS